MTWQPIYILGLASMASAYLGGLPSDQMTIAVSPLAEQVLLNTTDRAEAVKSRVTVPQHDLDGIFLPEQVIAQNAHGHEEDKFFDAVETFETDDDDDVFFDAVSYHNVNLSTFERGSFQTNRDGSVQTTLKSGKICKLDTLLGGGAQGSVYACGDKAVKFIKGKEKATQCANEFTLQHKVQSAFVVQAEEAFVLNHEFNTATKIGDTVAEEIPKDSLCIVMEKLDTDLRKKKFQFTGRLQLTKDIWVKVLKGVEALHEADIIYRDLKPDNVLCNPSTKEVKISDFGSASEGVGQFRHDLVGTPAYLAPEIVPKILDDQAISYNGAVDAWTLGILLYELYFGKTPFQDFNAIKKNKVEFPPGDKHIPEAPFQMKDLIQKCLEKDPSKRYRVHANLPGEMPLISSHPFVTGGEEREQKLLYEWLGQHQGSDTASSKVSAFVKWVYLRLKGWDATSEAPAGEMSSDILCPAMFAAVNQKDVEMVDILVKNVIAKNWKEFIVNCKDERGTELKRLAHSLYMEAAMDEDQAVELKRREIKGYLDSL